MKGKRSIGITALAAFFILGALALLALGLLAVAGSAIIGIPFVLLGLFAFVVAYGLLKMERWGWWAAVIWICIGTVGSIIGAVLTANLGGILGIVIGISIVYYLTRPDTKKLFGV